MATNLMSIRSLEKRNEEFKKLTKKQQRIAIAEDVIAQVKLGKYIPTPGVYVRHWDADVVASMYQNVFGKKKPPACEVCALGAAYVSRARLGNNTSEYDDLHDNLAEIFGKRNVGLMESAFEKWHRTVTAAKSEVAESQLDDPDERLIAIFENIIKNGGNFKLVKAKK